MPIKTITSGERDQCHPFSALRRARTAICISATLIRRCSISIRAREAGGRFLLRIEDIDAARCKPEFEAAIYEDLAWLGIAWETPVRRQSQHLADYRAALEKLAARGLIYPSFESRAEIARLVAEREALAPWPRDPDGAPLYPGSGEVAFAHGARTIAAIRRTLCAAA